VTRTVLSPNYSEGWPYGKPQAVMIHSTRSGRADFSHAQELEATLNWFSRRDAQVSSHWVISDTEAVRVVADENRAWAAGQHNGYVYAIELTQALTTTPYTEGHYRLLAAIVEPYILQGVPILFEHFYVNGRKGFTGHEDSNQGKQAGKSDPGDLFNWDKFIGMLRGEPEEEEDDDMRSPLVLLHAEGSGAIYLSDWMTKRHIEMPELIMFRYIHVPEAEVPADILDAIPVVEGD